MHDASTMAKADDFGTVKSTGLPESVLKMTDEEDAQCDCLPV
jgi:hypothetical protein